MPDLELTILAGSTFVAKGPTNIGVYAPEGAAPGGRAVLIDSGNDDDAGRKVLRACETAGLKVSHIANTHSNADHCGANAFVQARTNCRIAAPRVEVAFIESPSLEPAFLWGGFPLPPLRNKFLVAKASRVTDFLEAPCTVPGAGIEALPLPGHYVGMVGYLTPDKVFFAADAAASPEILAKYRYYYVYDVAAHLATLEALAVMDVDWIVPSHAEPTREAGPLVAANKAKILEVGERILELCGPSLSMGPATPDELIVALAASYGLELNHTQYALLGSTLRSYLAWLSDKGLVLTRLEANRLVVERK
jgi:glyoxylase-like metal-dependent hydrolase (beta-lactamase superfamily II)